VKLSISYTTRPKRKNEKNEKDYFFVNREKFNKLVKKNFPINEAVEPKAIKTKEKPKVKKIVLITTKLFFFSISVSNDVPEI